MLDLTGKVAVLTGCSSGIGAETARLFSRQGAAVVIIARRESILRALEQELTQAGGRVLVLPGDITVPGFADEVCDKTVETFGHLDILVNCAGMSDKHRAAVRTSDEFWEQVVTLNETAPFYFCRAALRHMTRQGSGVIVNVSSIGGYYSCAGAAYSSSKAALIGLTKNIGVQYAGTGIRCNAVCPGATETPMLAPSEDFDAEMQEITGRRIDLTTGMSQPIDMANAILFLSADESRYINGQALVVDKGACI